MSNSIGTLYRFTVWGQSHAPGIGVTVEGLPAGFRPDWENLSAFLARRAPGKSDLATPRKEADEPEVLSGLNPDGLCCGAPMTVLIRNANTRSGDYENLRRVPRPGHADLVSWLKYGSGRDVPGGGQFSGRLTAPLCVAGGLALQLLAAQGVSIHARAAAIGGETEPDAMRRVIEQAKAAGDSVGGIIECVCEGVPAGLGDPMFDGMENRLSRILFGIPAVKAVEFGAGFGAASLRGSECNDPFYVDENGAVRSKTNRAGGILGGITTGMPVVFRLAVKPTPSIGIEQDSVDLETNTNTKLTVQGRHDPCIVPRAVPVVEAAAACAIYDAGKEALAWS